MYDFIIISCDNNMKGFFKANKKNYLSIKKNIMNLIFAICILKYTT